MGPPATGSGAEGKFIVQRLTEQADNSGQQPGAQPRGPWSWQLLSLPPSLAGYLLAVVTIDLALTGWLLTRTSPHGGQVLLFAAFLTCGAVCVEATRRWGAPPPGTRELLSVWWLPAALLLPPLYALTAPALTGVLSHWRARRGPAYWRVFTAAALGLAGAAASALFHLAAAHGRWFLHPATLVIAAACGAGFVMTNAVLVAVAAAAADPEAPGHHALWDSEWLT
jgi:hypothetical protein